MNVYWDYVFVSFVLIAFSSAVSKEGSGGCNLTDTLKYQVSTCPGKGYATEEGCVKANCCFNDTLFASTSANCFKTYRRDNNSNTENAICLIYNGSLCSESFNQRLSRPPVPRLFVKKYNITGTEIIMQEIFNILDTLSSKIKEPSCKAIFKSTACSLVMPECAEEEQKALQLCREDCEHIFKVCKSSTQFVLGAIDIVMKDKGYYFFHSNFPTDCSYYKYSYNGAKCMQLLKDIDRTKPVASSKRSKAITIIIVVACLCGVVLLMIMIGLYCYRRRVIQKKNIEETETEFTEPIMRYQIPNKTIREHIRSGSDSATPLMELLASSKPGELIQYSVDSIEYVNDLGEGEFGKVFQGRIYGFLDGEKSTDVAVKCLKKGSSEEAKASFNQEVALMSVLQHNNILRLLAVSTEEEPFCMIFELMEEGDLKDFLKQWNSKEYLNDSQLIHICKHIAAGMEYLASKKFLHRDLATRNCLVGKHLMVKIADFGMSRNVYSSDYYVLGKGAKLPIRWMPPETIMYGKFTMASDVYSFGVVMWEIFSFALQPFYGYNNKDVIEFIKKGVLLSKPEDCPEWIYDIMLNCWKKETKDRITFTQALKILVSEGDDQGIFAEKPSRYVNLECAGQVSASQQKPPLPSTTNEYLTALDGDVMKKDDKLPKEKPAYINHECVGQGASRENEEEDNEKRKDGKSGNGIEKDSQKTPLKENITKEEEGEDKKEEEDEEADNEKKNLLIKNASKINF